MNTKLFPRAGATYQTLTPCQPTTMFRRFLQRILASWILSLLLLALPSVAQAQYRCTTNNGALTITGYTGLDGAVAIPSTINGLPVTSIGDSAFYFRTSLTNVTIPGSITNIADGAFYDCYNLTTILVDGSNPVYSSVDGVLFNQTQTTLIQCPQGKAGS